MKTKKIITVLAISIVLVSSCNPQPSIPATSSATHPPPATKKPVQELSNQITESPANKPLTPKPTASLVVLETYGNPKDGGAAVSPNGRYLAVGESAVVKVWSVDERKEMQALGGINGRAYEIVFSPDSSLLALFDNDFVIEIWEVETGQMKTTLSVATPGSEVMTFAFSPDGKTLASGHSDLNVRIWDLENGELTYTLQGHSGSIDSVAFSPDGSLLASGEVNTGYMIKLWDLNSGVEVRTLIGHRENVYSLSFSPDGKYLASASGDRTVKLWDVEAGENIHSFSGHSDRIYSVVFSPDGAWLASGSSDRTVRIWDVENKRGYQVLRGSSDMHALGFSPNSSLLFTAEDGKPVTVWGYFY